MRSVPASNALEAADASQGTRRRERRRRPARSRDDEEQHPGAARPGTERRPCGVVADVAAVQLSQDPDGPAEGREEPAGLAPAHRAAAAPATTDRAAAPIPHASDDSFQTSSSPTGAPTVPIDPDGSEVPSEARWAVGSVKVVVATLTPPRNPGARSTATLPSTSSGGTSTNAVRSSSLVPYVSDVPSPIRPTRSGANGHPHHRCTAP
jgi:hypothetical protein